MILQKRPYCNNTHDDIFTLRRVQEKFIAMQISHRIVYWSSEHRYISRKNVSVFALLEY